MGRQPRKTVENNTPILGKTMSVRIAKQQYNTMTQETKQFDAEEVFAQAADTHEEAFTTKTLDGHLIHLWTDSKHLGDVMKVLSEAWDETHYTARIPVKVRYVGPLTIEVTFNKGDI